MKCPYCSKEMEHGIIPQERNGLFYWIPKNFPDLFITPGKIRKNGGVIVKPFFSGNPMYGWLCRDCGQIIISFSPEKNENSSK